MADNMLDIHEVAKRLSYSHWTVRNRIAAGKLKSSQSGKRGKHLIRESEVERFLNESANPSENGGTESTESEGKTSISQSKPPDSESGTEKAAKNPPKNEGNSAPFFPLGAAIIRMFRK